MFIKGLIRGKEVKREVGRTVDAAVDTRAADNHARVK